MKKILIFIFLVLPIVFATITTTINTDWEVSHEITMNAQPETAWAILADLDNYQQWNRYSPKVSGKFAEGEIVWVEAHLDDDIKHVKNHILTINPPHELCWQSGDWFGFLANGKRCRWLTKVGDGKTRLVHHEIMQGPLAWLIEIIYRERIERGLKLVDESLAKAAEKAEAQNSTKNTH